MISNNFFQNFNKNSEQNNSFQDIGKQLSIAIIKNKNEHFAQMRYHNNYIKTVNFLDKPAKKLFILELVEMGAEKTRISTVLNISRQTIHNYIEIKKNFGIEGLIHGYSTGQTKEEQREIHSNKRISGNKARLLEQMRKKKKEQINNNQQFINFSFDSNDLSGTVKKDELPYTNEHDWEPTRYAGNFIYLISLTSIWKWLTLIIGYFGVNYKILMVFILMVANNIRSIEQLKNVVLREAGHLLGMIKLPAKNKLWEWFYSASNKKISKYLLFDYFKYQIKTGLVSFCTWLTDGHLLPYTGKAKVHYSYNTQRRMPFPGQTNIVTSDMSGKIVDFEIEEGKGDLKSRILKLSRKWENDLPETPIMVFDREGYDSKFFSKLVKANMPFVTWDKYVDSKKMKKLADTDFTVDFEFNGKEYSVFEGEKKFKYIADDSEGKKKDKKKEHIFKLRHIFLWNKKSGKKTCGLAYNGLKEISLEDCTKAILSRWGASENTFKHLAARHPLGYHPGFKLIKSEKQEISNPAIKVIKKQIDIIKKQLNKLYKKLSKTEESVNKNGEKRINSIQEKTKNEIMEKETSLNNLKEKLSKSPERINVLELENYRSFKKIDNEGKNLFDFVTASIWNARKVLVDELKEFYDNENDVVDLFYTISKCHGWIKSAKTEVIVRIEPLQQFKRRVAQEKLCRKLTSMFAQSPTGKWLKIEVGKSPF